MKTIRKGVFETNSSSTHSCTIMSEEDYKKMESDETLVYKEGVGVMTVEEAKEWMKKNTKLDPDTIEDDFKYAARDCDFESLYDEYLDTDHRTYTTPKGETIVIVCKYGYDG